MKSGENASSLRAAWEKAVSSNDLTGVAKALAGLETLEPKDPRWPHRRGDALCRIKQFAEAEAAYARAMTLYVEQGFLPRAIAVAKRVVELNPSRRDLLLALDNAPTRQVAAAKNIPIIPWTEVKGIAGARPLARAEDAGADEVRFDDAEDENAIEITIEDLEEVPRRSSTQAPADASAEHLLTMSSTKLFAGVPREVLTALAGAAELVELERGDVLFSKGDPADALYVVVEGSARLDIPGVGAINIVEAQAFGEACMLDGGIRAGDVRARTRLSLLRIPRSALGDIVRSHPALENVLFDLLLHRLVGDLLVTSPIFTPFDVPTRLELARFFEVRRVANGTTLAEFGRRSDGLYVVLAGEIHVEDASGARRMPPGSIFGKETLASSGAPSRRSVRVLRGEGAVLRLPAARFESLAAKFPDALAHISKLTASLGEVRLEPSSRVDPVAGKSLPPEDLSARTLAPSEQTRAAVPAPTPSAAAPPGPGDMPSERYVDAGELARGGMGVIHKVISRAILREEAMKLISPSFATTPGAHARFLEEAQIHGQLEHPNILPVHDLALDEEGRPVYFTMQLAHGKTLRKLFEEYPVAERFGPPLERLLRILVHVCDAVSFAHTRGVIHCDIKPDNIMVASHGRTYLLDWGCAKLRKGQRPSGAGGSRSASAVSPDESHVFGTFAYMAPEQANGAADAIDERTDVFALGGLLYKFLTNRAPFFASHDDESMELARRGDVRPPGEVFENAQLPSELCRIALKALAKDPNDRYPTADAFKEEIERSIRWGVWFESRVFPAGSLVVKEGDPADAAYIVKRGLAEAFKTVNGRREVLRKIAPDESIGEAALLSDATRTASVVALEDLHVVVITRESLERELARDSWVGALVRSLAARFRDRDAGLSAERAAR